MKPITPLAAYRHDREQNEKLERLLRASVAPDGPHAQHRCGFCHEKWADHDGALIEQHAAEIIRPAETDNPKTGA